MVEELDCGRDDILNFDKAGFCIRMCQGEDIIVPTDVNKVCILNYTLQMVV
jgi:hypothetical protein